MHLGAGQRPLRRTPDSLQLGLTDEAVVLCGLSAAEAAVVESLDGRHTLSELYALASRRGVERTRVDALLGRLAAEGLLAAPEPERLDRASAEERASSPRAARRSVRPTQPLRLTPPGQPPSRRVVGRAHRYVLVGGAGPVPESLAATLVGAGVGRVELGPWALDYVELELRDRPGVSEVPDLVVLASPDALDPRAERPWRRHGAAVLAVVADLSTVVVGPLVADPAAPCLSCLQLHRTDRDPQWPLVLAQACPPGAVARPVHSEPTLAATAAGVAAMVSVAHLDGHSFPGGLTVELRLPLPRLDHRVWPRHPHCGEHGGQGGTDRGQ